MADHSMMALGKKAAVHDPRTLKLRNYIDLAALPEFPKEFDFLTPAGPMPMYRNDEIGNCAIAGPAHQVKAWTALSLAPTYEPTEQEVLDEYGTYGGWPQQNDGCVLLDVMNGWRQKGLFGHKIESYVSVDLKNDPLVDAAMWLFGSISIGLALPLAAQSLDIWDVPAAPAPRPLFHRFRRRAAAIVAKMLFGREDEWAPNSWGGHMVPLMGRKQNGNRLCCTWGATKEIAPAFTRVFGDEGYVPLSPNWINGVTQKAPNGFGLADLRADLARVAA